MEPHSPEQEGREPEGKIRLETNPTLLALTDYLVADGIPWGETADYYKQLIDTGRFRYGRKHFVGDFIEIGMNICLDNFAKGNQGVTLDPIAGGEASDQYRFRKGTRGLYAAAFRSDAFGKMRWEDVAEYDRIAVIEGLPCVFEAKAGRKASRGRDSVAQSIAQKRIDEDLSPLQEYFNSDTFGYVLATNSNIITNTNLQEEFQQRNGLLLSFAPPYPGYEARVQQIYDTIVPDNLRRP